jgi:hypothetical protein
MSALAGNGMLVYVGIGQLAQGSGRLQQFWFFWQQINQALFQGFARF